MVSRMWNRLKNQTEKKPTRIPIPAPASTPAGTLTNTKTRFVAVPAARLAKMPNTVMVNISSREAPGQDEGGYGFLFSVSLLYEH